MKSRFNMPIYTRTGDKGQTSLATGQRISKDSPVIEFIGWIDELNSYLGICVSQLLDVEDGLFNLEIEVLQSIQKDLFVISSIASGAQIGFKSLKEVSNIEKTIDDYEKLLPKLKNFIISGGDIASANLHYARSLSRKIERQAVALKSQSIMIVLPYLNRLSDLLFVMARYVNFKMGYEEFIYKG